MTVQLNGQDEARQEVQTPPEELREYKAALAYIEDGQRCIEFVRALQAKLANNRYYIKLCEERDASVVEMSATADYDLVKEARLDAKIETLDTVYNQLRNLLYQFGLKDYTPDGPYDSVRRAT